MELQRGAGRTMQREWCLSAC